MKKPIKKLTLKVVFFSQAFLYYISELVDHILCEFYKFILHILFKVC